MLGDRKAQWFFFILMLTFARAISAFALEDFLCKVENEDVWMGVLQYFWKDHKQSSLTCPIMEGAFMKSPCSHILLITANSDKRNCLCLELTKHVVHAIR